MRRQPRSGKRHVLRWVAVGAVVIVAAGTLGAYLKYRAVYDSITRVTVPTTALGHRPPVYSTNSQNILVYGDDNRTGLTPHRPQHPPRHHGAGVRVRQRARLRRPAGQPGRRRADQLAAPDRRAYLPV